MPYPSLESLQQIFMRRDGMTQQEATDLIEDMRQEVLTGRDPEEVLYDEGLEPDYIFDLID